MVQGVEVSGELASRPTAPVSPDTACNLGQPGDESLGFAQLDELLIDAEEHVLGLVLGEPGVARRVVTDRANESGMPVVEDGERFAIAALGPSHEFRC